MDELTGKEVLDLAMDDNDAGAETIRGYLKQLLANVWAEGESFSGKRPFGNSGWEYELYRPLVQFGKVKGRIDEYGDMYDFSETECNTLIFAAIDALS